ncbi:MAG: hypothetical protein WBS22_16560 [Methylocystis sp.]
MKSGSKLLLLGAAVVGLAGLDLDFARAAPIARDTAATSASPAEDAAEFCLPGWRLNFHNRCVPKRRRWWFR